MNPDSYMPFFGNEFFISIDGQSDAFGRCYLRAIWYYWHHTHCEGLKADKTFLRGICHADSSEWDELYDLIFDNQKYFTLDEELNHWHQKRAAEEYVKAKAKYDAVVKGGRNRQAKLRAELPAKHRAKR